MVLGGVLFELVLVVDDELFRLALVVVALLSWVVLLVGAFAAI